MQTTTTPAPSVLNMYDDKVKRNGKPVDLYEPGDVFQIAGPGVDNYFVGALITAVGIYDDNMNGYMHCITGGLKRIKVWSTFKWENLNYVGHAEFDGRLAYDM